MVKNKKIDYESYGIIPVAQNNDDLSSYGIIPVGQSENSISNANSNDLRQRFPFKMQNGNKPLADIIPGARQITPGMKEGFQESLSAIPGIGKYMPTPTPQAPVPSEEGASTFRNVGRIAGGAPVIAGLAAPMAMGGEALGIPAAISEIGSAGVAGGLTTPGDLFHRAIGAVESAAPVGAGKALLKLPEVMKTLTSKVNPKEWPYAVQKAHDFLESKAKDIYNFVKGEAQPRGVGNLELDKDLFNEIKELPISSSKEFKDLVSRAEKGDYEALRDLQSEIGSYGSEIKGSSLASERYTGRSILNLRKRFNEDMYKKMEERGAGDLAKMLKEANEHYTNMHEIYHQVPSIKKIVSKEKGRIIPKNPISALSEESDRIKPFLSAHPEIGEGLKLHANKKEIMKSLKNIGIPVGSSIGSALSTAALMKYLFGDKEKPEAIESENIGEGNA